MSDIEKPFASQRHLEFTSNQIKTCLINVHQSQYMEVFKMVGLDEVIAYMNKDKTLEEADLDDVERLSKLSISAMERGMKEANAQMVRAFHSWMELREGEKEMEGVTVQVVPATVPDNMSDKLSRMLTELSQFAASSNV